MSGRPSGPALIVAALMAAVPGPAIPAAAQSGLAELRSGARDGAFAFRYAARPDVRSCGGGWTRGDRAGPWRDDDCWTGPVEIRIDVEGGVVVSLDADVVRPGTEWPGERTRLGTVDSKDGADYLLDLVPGADPGIARDAIGAATLAEGVDAWRRLLGFARDTGLDTEVRSAATFQVGQAAADEVLEGLESLLDDPDRRVREAALFALSESQGEAAVPLLLRVAESDSDPDLRRAAFFWLSQKEDPRVLAFFDRILTGG